jgi:hypothetical protein
MSSAAECCQIHDRDALVECRAARSSTRMHCGVQGVQEARQECTVGCPMVTSGLDFSERRGLKKFEEKGEAFS